MERYPRTHLRTFTHIYARKSAQESQLCAHMIVHTNRAGVREVSPHSPCTDPVDVWTYQKVLLGGGQGRELEFVVLVHRAGCRGAAGPSSARGIGVAGGGVSWTIGAVCCEAPHACPPCCPLTDESRDPRRQTESRERERERSARATTRGRGEKRTSRRERRRRGEVILYGRCFMPIVYSKYYLLFLTTVPISNNFPLNNNNNNSNKT